MKRKIIKIDESKCNGCSLCLPNCPEGAIKIIDGKARLISDLFCDGLGACLGHCPQGAISIEEREAQNYDERKVMEVIVKQGSNTIKEHLNHLKEHNQKEYLSQALDYLRENKIPVPVLKEKEQTPCGCPSAKVRRFEKKKPDMDKPSGRQESKLAHWPVQLRLAPAAAEFFQDADILIAADCVPCAYPDFHSDLLDGKVVLLGCPKFDDLEYYREKLTDILSINNIKSITYAHMEVPCCLGMLSVIEKAIAQSGKDTDFKDVTISISGERI